MISAETDYEEPDCEDVANAGATAGLLMKVLRSVDRHRTGPISTEALQVSDDSQLRWEIRAEAFG